MKKDKIKKDILFIHINMYSGGSQKSLISLLNSIDYTQYAVDLFLFRKDGMFLRQIPNEVNILTPDSEIQEKLYIMVHTGKELLKRRHYGMAFRKSYYKIINVLRNKLLGKTMKVYLWDYLSKKINYNTKKYDAAIAYTEGYPTFYLVEKVSAKVKLAWLHAMSYRSDYYLKYYRQIDKIIGVSDSCLYSFNQAYPELEEKTMVIKNIVSSKLIKNMSNEMELNNEFNKCVSIKILTIARVAHMKGLDIAQEALNILTKKGFDIKWFVIGDCQNKHHMDEIHQNVLCNNKLIFLGEISNPYPYIKQCDLYVQPSRVEPYGLVVDEAIILQKPVVVTNLDSFVQRLNNERDALICECNGEHLAKSIETLITNDELRKYIISNTKNIDLDTTDEIEKIYELI